MTAEDKTKKGTKERKMAHFRLLTLKHDKYQLKPSTQQ
jgi:hypothetical protein